MMADVARDPASPETTLRTAKDRCPYQKALTAVGRVVLYPAFSNIFSAAPVAQPVVQIRIFVSGLTSKSRSHQKRGPPSLLS
jgi:hypothetical protein